MPNEVLTIPIPNLLLGFIPVVAVGFVLWKWKLNYQGLVYASLRMLSQLLLVGYGLSLVFTNEHSLVTALIVMGMLLIAAWIALYPIREVRRKYYARVATALILGALPVLLLVTTIVIPSNHPWYQPAFLIPLAGMILANSMNTISLAAERYSKEVASKGTEAARKTALEAALIPQINSFFAVGLVSLPGMMTGQILSGVDPLIAARYQIVVMTMVVGAGGLSSILYLKLAERHDRDARNPKNLPVELP